MLVHRYLVADTSYASGSSKVGRDACSHPDTVPSTQHVLRGVIVGGTHDGGVCHAHITCTQFFSPKSGFGAVADSRLRARGADALHQLLQRALLSFFTRARVANVGAVVLVRDAVAVKQAFLSCRVEGHIIAISVSAWNACCVNFPRILMYVVCFLHIRMFLYSSASSTPGVRADSSL